LLILPQVYISSLAKPPSGAVTLEAVLNLCKRIGISSLDEIFRAFMLTLVILIWAAQTYTCSQWRIERDTTKQKVFQQSHSNRFFAELLNRPYVFPLIAVFSIQFALLKNHYFASELETEESLSTAINNDFLALNERGTGSKNVLVNTPERRLQYARGNASALRGIWLNIPCYKAASLTSGYDIKTITPEDVMNFLRGVLSAIGPIGSFQAETFTVDVLKQEVRQLLPEAEDGSPQDVSINDAPIGKLLKPIPMDSLLGVTREDSSSLFNPSQGVKNPLYVALTSPTGPNQPVGSKEPGDAPKASRKSKSKSSKEASPPAKKGSSKEVSPPAKKGRKSPSINPTEGVKQADGKEE
jgi:hypothetical protein